MIKADCDLVTDTSRGTTLQVGDAKISTVEHILAALVGLEIDNCIIELNASEPPIMDGSSKYFIEILETAGFIEQEAFVEEYIVKEIISYKDEKTGSEIMIMPSDKYELTTMVDFGTNVLGTQNASITKISEFKKEISDSRTFSFLHEIEMLLDHGLIKGGDLNNAIVYVDKELSPDIMDKLRVAFGKDDIAVKPNGILNNLTFFL